MKGTRTWLLIAALLSILPGACSSDRDEPHSAGPPPAAQAPAVPATTTAATSLESVPGYTFTDADFERHLLELKRKVPAGDAFTIVIQKPFVVIGDETPDQVRKRADGTVKWAVDCLKAKFFDKDPTFIFDIWGLTNWRLAGLQEAILDRRLPPFEDLTAKTATEFYDEDPGTNYAQSRYLCYFLQEKGLLPRFYREFRAASSQDPTGLETLKKVLEREDMEAFRQEWEEYVFKLRFP